MVRGGRNRSGGGGGLRGRGRGGSSRGRAGGGPQNSEFPENKHLGFSLAEEAKNTGRHHGEYGASALRHSKVSFVAAGHLDSTELFKPLNADGPRPPTEQTHDSTDATEEDDPLTSEGPDNSLPEVSTGLLPQDVDMENLDLDPPEPLAFVATTSRSPKKKAPVQAFVVDIIGDPSLRPKKQIPIRSPSPGSVSSSGSEKIVFVPRRMRLGPVGSRASPPIKSRAAPRTPSPRLPVPREQSSMPTETVETTTSYITTGDPVPEFTAAVAAAAIIHNPEDVPTHQNPFPTKFSGRVTQGNKHRRRRHRKKPSSDDDAVIEDYIENITATIRAEATEAAAAAYALETGESSTALNDVDIAALNSKTNHRELGAEDDWSSTDSDEAAEDSDAVNKYKAEQLWEEHELADFDNVSTSSEGLKGVVDAVLRKRVRPSGTQYLVQWRGLGTDNSTWVRAETLDSSADAKIETYEATRAAASSDGGNDEDQDSDEEQDVDSDLKLARLLQRQEMLGITDSDLELNVELDGLTEFELAAFTSAGKKERNRFLPEIAPNAATGFFPSASRLADAYDDFDPMDWERPSLSRGKKQKKGKGKVIVPDLSDEELQDSLRSSWMKDREKKKTRNAEREALRAEGLLGGGKHGKKDLKAKYKNSVTIEELQMEIQEFLMGKHQSLELPPMDKSLRKTVHEIASTFGIKSKSFGSNRMRFPVLFKTTRTAMFTDENSIRAAMMNRRPLNRPSGRRGGGAARPAKGGAGGVVHHREGDIVGGSAPEIGIENRGRRMLEKMGYVSGMALGVEGREGIVKPVEAVVKISKAGLG